MMRMSRNQRAAVMTTTRCACKAGVHGMGVIMNGVLNVAERQDRSEKKELCLCTALWYLMISCGR